MSGISRAIFAVLFLVFLLALQDNSQADEMRSHLFLLLLLVPLGVSAASTQTATAEPWLTYEDTHVRFQYPRGRKIWTWDDKASKRMVWNIDIQTEAGKHIEVGSIDLYQYYDGEEKRPLKEIADDYAKGEYILLHSTPSQIEVKGARCLMFIWEAASGLSVDSDVQEAIAEAVCYGHDRKYVNISAFLSRYPFDQRGRLSDEGLRNAEIFNRFLKGLEFKP